MSSETNSLHPMQYIVGRVRNKFDFMKKINLLTSFSWLFPFLMAMTNEIAERTRLKCLNVDIFRNTPTSRCCQVVF
uniref:Uncharacterized protein n=1 Tax=Octopus bimaculoides TaxID=37653 RepID=A0A0L8G4T7_OCTBM